MNKSGVVSRCNISLSVKQNDEVYSLLSDQGVKISPMLAGDVIEIADAVLTTICPMTIATDSRRSNAPLAHHRDYGFDLDQLADMPIKASDHSINNKNSIVFIFEYDDKCLLFTGDAWADDIISDIIKELGEVQHHFDLIKLPHHGAVGNIAEDFKNHIECSDFLVCTDGVMHPDKQTIAKLAKWYGKDINIYSPSNWWSDGFFTEDDGKNDKSRVNLIHREGMIIRW